MPNPAAAAAAVGEPVRERITTDHLSDDTNQPVAFHGAFACCTHGELCSCNKLMQQSDL